MQQPSGLSKRSLAIAGLSTIVEWYDFTLYLYLAALLSRIFYGGGAAGVGHVLAGFAIAYLMRPLGAIVFGHIGDRHGRRPTMLLSMALMSAAMLATALLPTQAQAGATAGWLLLALRCVMAFSVGGEYTGVVAYLLEGAPPGRRGLITSLASAASEVGGLLAVALSALTVALLGEAALADWGWRIPFLVGAGLAALILLARSRIEESPDFLAQRARGSIPAQPLRLSLRAYRPAIGRGFAISALGSITYYVGIVYVPSFLIGTGRMGEADALTLSTLAALGGAVSAVGAVTTAEQFPGEGRLSGLAFGATSATALFGGLTPYLSHQLTQASGWASAPGWLIAIVALGVLPVLWRLPESAPKRQLPR